MILFGFNKKSIRIALVLLLSVASFAIRNEVTIALWGGSMILYIAFNFHKLTVNDGRACMFFLVMLTLVTCSLPYALINSAASAFHYFVFVMTLSTAYLMRESLHCFYHGVRIVLYSSQLVVVLFVLYHGVEGYPLEEMISGSSSNVITSFLIVLQATFSILNYSVNRRFDIFPALITMSICIVGYGRASIIASFLILFVNVSYFIFSSKKILLIAFVIFVFGVFTLGGQLSEGVADFINSKTKIGSGLYDSTRLEMHKDYFSKIDVVTAFVGADYEGTSIEREYNGNPHSSYIRAHHIFGVFFIFGILLSLLFIALSNTNFTFKTYLLLITTVVLSRAATEPVLFPTPLDIFFYGYVFSILYNPKGEQGMCRFVK